MNELIKLETNNDRIVVSSLNISNVFSKKHSDVLKAIKELSCSLKFRERNFSLSSYMSSQNKELPSYLMTKDGFSFLVMGFTGEKASKFKEDYITKFNEMERNMQPQQLTRLEILQMAIESEKKVLQLEIQVKEQKLKVDFFNDAMSSETLIDINDCSKTLLIKKNGKLLGRNLLYEELRNLKVLDSNNKPYQKYVNSGYFKLVEKSYTHPTTGESIIYFKTMITQKGISKIHNIFKED